jgi:GNAT superfamily N-acetyltransferase
MIEFDVIKASVKDSEDILSLLKEVAYWLKDKEINQWGYLLQGGDDCEILQAIENQDTFVVLKDDVMVGTFTLSTTQSEWDQHIFGADETNDSLYIHRLAVFPRYMGKGIGKSILEWIEENHQSKKTYLKLDCVADNERLNQFYRENGFTYMGETDNHSKYQKILNKAKNQSFRTCLKSFIDSWKRSSLDDLKRWISVDYQAREVRDGEIFDFGYEESIDGWEQAFNQFLGNDVQWVLTEVGIIPLKDNEVMAILRASLIMEGKPSEISNLFFETFRMENGEWQLVRSYIEAGLPLETRKRNLIDQEGISNSFHNIMENRKEDRTTI